jgi:hypothetical protein
MSPADRDDVRDEFLSEEDLDIGSLTPEELAAHWRLWFEQAQATNDEDQWTYSHGVFEEVPEAARGQAE